MESGNSLKKASGSVPKWCLESAKIFNHTLSYKKARGLALSVLISKAAPDFKKIETSAPLSLYAVTKILKHIIRIKVILSFSNNPLFTYLYTWKVRKAIILSTLLVGRAAFSESSMDSMKSLRNYSRDELYIQFT